MPCLQTKYERTSHYQELLDIENDAIIECMLSEIEILEMKNQVLVMQATKKCRALGIKSHAKGLYDRYGIVVMEKVKHTIATSPKKWINKLKIVGSLFIITWGGGISKLFPY